MVTDTLNFTTQDFEYVRHGDRGLALRLYRPTGPGPFPVVIDLHGGAWTNGDLTMTEWKRAGDTIKTRLTENKRQLAKQSNLAAVADWIGNGELLRAQWADLSLPRQQAIIMAVIDHIVIGPGQRGYNRFDHTRVTPIWRDAQAVQAPAPN